MKKERIILSFLLALLCTGTIFLWKTSAQTAQAVHEDLSDHILRFHVLANSDSDEDQALKLSVKTAVLNYLENALPDNADLESTKVFLENHESDIKKIAEDTISSAGYDYSVSIFLEPWYFPTKSYGDLTFPCGTYDALRIVIGDGGGKNWWCVLYPSLCFVDATYGVVPEDSKEELQTILDEDTYEALLPSENALEKPAQKAEKPRIRFRLAEWLAELF